MDRSGGPLTRSHLRQRNGLQDPPHGVGGGHPVSDRVVAEHQPVGQHVDGDVQYVLRQYVVAAAQQCEGAARRHEPEAGAGAGPVGDPLRDVRHAGLRRSAGREHHAHDVVDDRVVDEHP